MGNELDELTGPINPAGRAIHVINRQLTVSTGVGSVVLEIALWTLVPGISLALLLTHAVDPGLGIGALLIGVLPGVIFQVMKINGLAYLRQLEQRVQGNASQIDNYLEQRVVILQNVVGLVEKSIKIDKDIIDAIAAARSGVQRGSDTSRSEASTNIDRAFSGVSLMFEAYPNLKSHDVVLDAMRQNSTLEKEVTAARTLYNDSITLWNQEIFAWPTLQIVASKQQYTTRVPFSISTETRNKAREVLFGDTST